MNWKRKRKAKELRSNVISGRPQSGSDVRLPADARDEKAEASRPQTALPCLFSACYSLSAYIELGTRGQTQCIYIIKRVGRADICVYLRCRPVRVDVVV